jgi:8-oxo-dGTP pyrophosphatase MutT (NUDIX family)
MSYKIEYKFCPQCKRALTPTPDGDPHCEHCSITIYTDVAAAGCVLLIRDGQVLLARRAREPYKGDYDFVGGFMKPDETPEQTAIREAKEETGLGVKITRLLGMYHDRYGDDGPPCLGVVYLGEIEPGSAVAHDDVAALEWVDIDNLPPAAFESGFKSVRAALHDLQTWHREAKHE